MILAWAHIIFIRKVAISKPLGYDRYLWDKIGLTFLIFHDSRFLKTALNNLLWLRHRRFRKLGNCIESDRRTFEIFLLQDLKLLFQYFSKKLV